MMSKKTAGFVNLAILGSLLLLPVLCAAPARADLMLFSVNPMPLIVEEHQTSASIEVTLINSTVPGLTATTGMVAVQAPVPMGGDTGFDVVNFALDDGGADNKKVFAGTKVSFNVNVFIGDGDPTDKIKPPDDIGYWDIPVQVPWTRSDGVVSTLQLDLPVQVTDQVPEPSGLVAAPVGLLLLGGLFARRRK